MRLRILLVAVENDLRLTSDRFCSAPGSCPAVNAAVDPRLTSQFVIVPAVLTRKLIIELID